MRAHPLRIAVTLLLAVALPGQPASMRGRNP
jgi:hypothetical protein